MLRGAKLVTVAEDIGVKLSFHDCTLLLTPRGRAPYLVGCVAEIVAASVKMHSQHVYEYARTKIIVASI